MRAERGFPAAVAGAVTALVLVGGCDPCFGTPSCRGNPQVGYGGQVIEHRTGRPVAGVRLAFARRSGVDLEADTLVAHSDEDGWFQLRSEAYLDGEVVGDLIVTPPAPFEPYTVRDVRLQTSPVRGNSVFAGRLVVDPYYLFIGEVRDRRTLAIVPGAEVRVERTGGLTADPDTFTAISDRDGRTFTEMRMHGAGILEANAIVTAPGYPRPYRIPMRLRARYLDLPAREIAVLKLGSALQYVAFVQRRGSPGPLPGTTLEFSRTGGIGVDPDTFAVAVPENGFVELPFVHQQEGELQGEFRVVPPAPYQPETFAVRMRTLDGDTTSLIKMAYGTHIYLRADFRYRATGLPVEEGIQGIVRRRDGLVFEPEGMIALIDSTNTFRYTAATPGPGTTVVDIEVRLRDPLDHDTITGVSIASRADSSASDLGTLGVGRWIPWRGQVLAAGTDAPVPDARVEFRRTGGVLTAPLQARTTSAADGTFRVGAGMVPLRDGAITGDVVITFDASAPWRDTTVAGVALTTSTDDTLRMLPPIRVRPQVP